MTKKKERSIWAGVWDLFRSFKLAIFLLIILGVLSIISLVLGELLNTRFPNWDVYYAKRFGEGMFHIMKAIGVFNPFHSYIYQFFLVLLAANIVICTFSRFKYYIHQAVSKSFRKTSDDFRNVNLKTNLELKGDSEKILSNIRSIFKKRFFKFYTSKEDGHVAAFATRGGFSRFGFILIHLGLLILLVGGVITSKFGYSVYKWGGKGDFIQAPGSHFWVRVDDFKIITNPKGQIKDYLATLTVVENGKDVLTKKIEVNRPLRYKGFNFYQSSYSLNARAIESAKLKIVSLDGKEDTTVTIPFKERVKLKGTPYSIEATDFVADFRLENNKVYSASAQPRNPAVEISVFKGDSLLYKEWLFLYFPDLHKLANAKFKTHLVSFRGAYMTGLEVTTNPGAGLILFGIAMMTLGIILSFYMYHKRYWILLESAKNGRVKLLIGGASAKGRRDFRREMDEIVKEIKHIS
ncbi:MAG: cytochrome c biogenesis protein ResB [Calditrichaeota bacterium]|nr:cytochrome c biogenesis protein ResB [Calditrichota bacterium]